MREAVVRTWRPGFVVDAGEVCSPLRRGTGDPAYQSGPDAVRLAANTPAGVGGIRVETVAGEVCGRGWGDGGEWLVDHLPLLLGAEDDASGFLAHHRVVGEALRRKPSLRLGATGRVWDPLVAAILEQKVTGYEARRSWRELARRFGTPAPGLPGMFAPPAPQAVRRIPDWEWHRAGVDGARRRALLASATVAHRLEAAVALGSSEGRELLRQVPGIGVWTAAEVAQRAWGDPDAVSFGDLHIPAVVGYALSGRPTDDAGLARLLEPYAGQRQRAVLYIEACGASRPRFGPRMPVRDYRRM
jgi:3-methyladenine DNA glycosylase/8-oxoguanine DNA glycosylase